MEFLKRTSKNLLTQFSWPNTIQTIAEVQSNESDFLWTGDENSTQLRCIRLLANLLNGNVNDYEKRGYIIKGTYPVVWCPHDQSPTGDHDRQTGEGVVAEEYTLIKYKMQDGTILPAATFRPETIYGITNIWINPDADYVKATVNGENWIISQTCANKLTEQLKKVNNSGNLQRQKNHRQNIHQSLKHSKNVDSARMVC